MMLATSYNLAQIPGIVPGRISVEACEVRIDEAQYQRKVRIHVIGKWYWSLQRNILSEHYIPPERIKCAARNWWIYMRNGWYWRNQSFH